MDNIFYEAVEQFARQNSGRCKLTNEFLIFKPWAKVNGQFAGALIAVIFTIIILPLSIWIFYLNFMVYYKINITTGDIYKEVNKKERFIMNIKSDLKTVQIVQNRVNGINAGKSFRLINKNGKSIALVTFNSEKNSIYFQNILNTILNS